VTTITLSPATPDGPAGSYAGAVLVKVAATVASGTVTETRCVLDPATPPSSFADLPSRPCIYMGTGAVVLGAGNHTVFGASSSSGGLVEAPVQKSFSIAAVPTPTPPPSPGSPPLSGVDVPPVVVVPPGPTVPATPPANTPPVVTGKQPPPVRKKPTAVQKANQVVARMKKQHLSACAVGIFTAGQQHQLLARGLALAPTKGTSRLVVTVDLVPVGKKRLERSFGGVPAVVTTTCVTTKNGKVSGVKKTRIVLEIEHTVTTPGTFVPDSPQLTQEGAQLIGALRQKIIQPLLLRCDGYTADFAPSPVDAQALSVARATAVCLALKQPTLVHPPVVVGHGDTHPIASNTTEAGRAQNRRVAITLYHRITPER
jgi:outer membrane protein OmpA-like peptidoglycan-associated protein